MLYVTSFEQIRKRKETTSYFKGFILDHYRYRGIEVFSSVRKRLKRYQYFKQWIDDDNSSTDAVVINCGWGELPIMLSLVNPQISIIALDDDEDKVSVAAQSIASVNDKVQIGMKTSSTTLKQFVASHNNIHVYLIEPSQEDITNYQMYDPIVIAK